MTAPHFYRKAVTLKSQAGVPRIVPGPLGERTSPDGSKRTGVDTHYVLVINESMEMATMITRQLLASLPHINIMYAPTIELAAWILKTRPIALIVSSEIMPDGGAHKLKSVIQGLVSPPDLLMVGRSVRSSVLKMQSAGYRMVSRRTLQKGFSSSGKGAPSSLIEPKGRGEWSYSPESDDLQPKNEASRLSSLGADLRNDLNNPLQEIVTMAFVARQTPERKELTNEALSAIEQAAKQLAGTVSGIEERIKAALE